MRSLYLAPLLFVALVVASPATFAMPVSLAKSGRPVEPAFEVGPDLYARCYLINQTVADASHRTYEGLVGGCR